MPLLAHVFAAPPGESETQVTSSHFPLRHVGDAEANPTGHETAHDPVCGTGRSQFALPSPIGPSTHDAAHSIVPLQLPCTHDSLPESEYDSAQSKAQSNPSHLILSPYAGKVGNRRQEIAQPQVSPTQRHTAPLCSSAVHRASAQLWSSFTLQFPHTPSFQSAPTLNTLAGPS